MTSDSRPHAALRVHCRVNGEPREFEVHDDDCAVEALRGIGGLTGTKLVCGEGVCGACTVLLDGTPVVSCLLPAAALQDREVTTIEGLGPTLHPVQRAFIAHDALQCGYCTPGFVVEAVAFHDRWRAERGTAEPSRDEVAQALAGHLCRCGAYLGIDAAVRDACAGRFDAATPASGPRVEALDKVTGRAVYTTDVQLPGQLEGAILRSPQAHARVRALDVAPARAVPGVRAAVSLLDDHRLLCFVGQEIAAVAAVDRAAARAALAAIRLELEPLPAVVGAEAGRADGAPQVYPRWPRRPPNSSEGPLTPARWRGNVRGPVSAMSEHAGRARRAIAQARERRDPLLVQGRWRTDVQVHTAFEPHACVARWQGGELFVHVSTQAAAHVAHQLAQRFGLATQQVHLRCEHVGGGFGAKLGLTPETVAAAALAREAGAPVRLALSREEEMSVAGYRPGAEIELALLADREHGLRALQVHAWGDAGIAAGSSIAMLCRLVYPAPAKDLRDYDVVSHLPPGTPFRGPGGPLAAWALEQAVDEAAQRLGEDPITLRRRWDPNPLRQHLYDWAQGLALWGRRRPAGSDTGRLRRGIGVAAGNWLYFYQTDCAVEAGVQGGRLFVASAVQDMGTGIRSVLADTLAQAFDVAPQQVEVRIGDTRLAKGPTSGGSRTTATLVPAVLDAAAQLQQRLAQQATTRRGLREATPHPAGLRHADGLLRWSELLADAADVRVLTERPGDDAAGIAGRPLAGSGTAGAATVWLVGLLMKLSIGRGYTGSVHVAEVEVDTLLGTTRVLRVAGGIAAGRVQAPALARAQCEGGVIQGIGYALYEHRELDPASGRVLTTGLEDYRIPGLGDVPEIELHFHEDGFDHVRGGGVGLGEISTLAVAASIGNAVHNATGWRPLHLPIRPARLLEGLAR